LGRFLQTSNPPEAGEQVGISFQILRELGDRDSEVKVWQTYTRIIKEKELEDALEMSQGFLKIVADYIEGQLQHAKILKELERYPEALVHIQNVIGKNPEHAKEAASTIGMILRSVENVKRGIGTIRQDVNISIHHGERTEIKGFQDLRSIPKVIEFEVKRQLNAVKSGKKLSKEVRKAEPDFTTSFLRPIPGAARLYPETDAGKCRTIHYT